MKTNIKLKIQLFLAIALMGISMRSFAALPQTISFQGKLTDASNNAQTGTYDFHFYLYPLLSGGSLEWDETQTGVTVANGLYNVILGVNTSFASRSIVFNKDYYLEVRVKPSGTSTDETLSPRHMLTSSPYAFYSSSSAHAVTASSASYSASAGMPTGTMVLLNTDEVVVSASADSLNAKSFTVPPNSYARVLVEAECGFEQSGNNDSRATFTIQFNGVNKRSVVSRLMGDNASDAHYDLFNISYSEAISNQQVDIDIDITQGAGTWSIRSLRVYGIY